MGSSGNTDKNHQKCHQNEKFIEKYLALGKLMRSKISPLKQTILSSSSSDWFYFSCQWNRCLYGCGCCSVFAPATNPRRKNLNSMISFQKSGKVAGRWLVNLKPLRLWSESLMKHSTLCTTNTIWRFPGNVRLRKLATYSTSWRRIVGIHTATVPGVPFAGNYFTRRCTSINMLIINTATHSTLATHLCVWPTTVIYSDAKFTWGFQVVSLRQINATKTTWSIWGGSARRQYRVVCLPQCRTTFTIPLQHPFVAP